MSQNIARCAEREDSLKSELNKVKTFLEEENTSHWAQFIKIPQLSSIEMNYF